MNDSTWGPITVPCFSCGAKVHEGCRTRTGNWSRWHVPRVRAWEALPADEQERGLAAWQEHVHDEYWQKMGGQR